MSYDDADLTVGEVLRSAGYATGCFGKWGGGVEDTPGHPNRQGFDEFFGQLHQVHAHFHYPFWVWHNETRYMLPGNENHQRNQYVHDEIHQQALKFIRANHERPFFAYLPYILPHVELVVPEEDELPYRGKFPKLKLPDPRKGYIGSDDAYVTYAGMISRLDRHVGEVLNLLTELGIEDNTLVIFTSDNGAQGGAWDPLLKFFTGAGSLRGHKGQFHEGGIRVPLIARWPSHIQADSTSDHVCAFWDVLPTLAEVAGVTPPADIDGISFLPTLTGKGEQREHESLYWEYPRGGRLDRAIRSGRHKMLVHARRSAIELYDLQADPGETTNVAPQHSELTQKLFEMMKQSHRPEREHPPEVKPPTVADYVR
jgi:arylsulfatase A-like enzyme